MPLVEVIPHASTSPQTVSTVVKLAKKQGKTPIVVADKTVTGCKPGTILRGKTLQNRNHFTRSEGVHVTERAAKERRETNTKYGANIAIACAFNHRDDDA